MRTSRPLIFFVDVDDTFVRSFGTKRIPIPETIRHLEDLKTQGAELYCWSSGGADYARRSAAEFGIENIFKTFLPKPDVIIDDLPLSKWRNLAYVHPFNCWCKDLASYSGPPNETDP